MNNGWEWRPKIQNDEQQLRRLINDCKWCTVVPNVEKYGERWHITKNNEQWFRRLGTDHGDQQRVFGTTEVNYFHQPVASRRRDSDQQLAWGQVGLCRPMLGPIMKNIFKGICEALHFLGSLKIVHRDVKKDNVIVDGSHVSTTIWAVGKYLKWYRHIGCNSLQYLLFWTLGYICTRVNVIKITSESVNVYVCISLCVCVSACVCACACV